MIWILLGYYLAAMSGDIQSPYHGPQILKDIRAGFSQEINVPEQRQEILQAIEMIEREMVKDNKRLLGYLKRADKLIAKGKLVRDDLEPIYLEYTNQHIQSIRKNTKALLAIKKKVSREEWEHVIQQILYKGI
jgi:hypothetical protein